MVRVLRHTAAWCFLAGAALVLMTALERFYFRSLSGGLPSLDTRIAGFTAEEGAAWLTALGPSGRESLIVWHYLTFDLVFPGLSAVALASLLFFASSHAKRIARLAANPRAWACAFLVLPYAVADYAENVVMAKLLSDTMSLDAQALTLASDLIVAKFVLLGLPLAALVILVILFRRRA